MTEAAGRLVARIPLVHERDVARARRAVSQAYDELGAKVIRKTRFVTAVSEIARNAIIHGGGGEMSVYVDARRGRVTILCRDDGPGIEDMQTAMRDGYSTTKSMGRGLGGAKRLADAFELISAPGEGTTVRMTGAA